MKPNKVLLSMTVLSFLAVSSCARKDSETPAERRHATVVMEDGTKVRGTVESSSETEITLAGDDNIKRTIPMKQVKSIAYEPAPAAQPQTQQKEAARNGYGDAPRASSAAHVRVHEIPAGTEIQVRTEETIDSATAAQGQSFAAEVSRDVLDASGSAVVPRGSKAQLVIVSASKGGQIRGASDLVLTLGSVSVGERRYELDTSDVQKTGKSGVGANKRTAEYTGGGAAIGAIIGAIAGGGKGAAIGAGAGAGAGVLTQILTKGKAIRVPVESVLTFRLDRPVRITAAE